MREKIPATDHKQIIQLIEDNKLTIHGDIWHYSFNKELWDGTFDLVKKNKGQVLLYKQPLDQWSPMLIYSNYNFSFDDISGFNVVMPSSSEHVVKDKLFWFLKLGTFESFLQRRDEKSNQPLKHFPSTKSFEKWERETDYTFFYADHNDRFFNESYNRIKPEGFLDAEYISELLKKNNKPPVTIKNAYLLKDNEVVAIAILADDGRSCNLFNITALKEGGHGLGICLCVKIVEYIAGKNYFSFDSGASGMYGNYKAKIFLDSFALANLDEKKPTLLKRILNKFQ